MRTYQPILVALLCAVVLALSACRSTGAASGAPMTATEASGLLLNVPNGGAGGDGPSGGGSNDAGACVGEGELYLFDAACCEGLVTRAIYDGVYCVVVGEGDGDSNGSAEEHEGPERSGNGGSSGENGGARAKPVFNNAGSNRIRNADQRPNRREKEEEEDDAADGPPAPVGASSAEIAERAAITAAWHAAKQEENDAAEETWNQWMSAFGAVREAAIPPFDQMPTDVDEVLGGCQPGYVMQSIRIESTVNTVDGNPLWFACRRLEQPDSEQSSALVTSEVHLNNYQNIGGNSGCPADHILVGFRLAGRSVFGHVYGVQSICSRPEHVQYNDLLQVSAQEVKVCPANMAVSYLYVFSNTKNEVIDIAADCVELLLPQEALFSYNPKPYGGYTHPQLENANMQSQDEQRCPDHWALVGIGGSGGSSLSIDEIQCRYLSPSDAWLLNDIDLSRDGQSQCEDGDVAVGLNINWVTTEVPLEADLGFGASETYSVPQYHALRRLGLRCLTKEEVLLGRKPSEVLAWSPAVEYAAYSAEQIVTTLNGLTIASPPAMCGPHQVISAIMWYKLKNSPHFVKIKMECSTLSSAP